MKYVVQCVVFFFLCISSSHAREVISYLEGDGNVLSLEMICETQDALNDPVLSSFFQTSFQQLPDGRAESSLNIFFKNLAVNNEMAFLQDLQCQVVANIEVGAGQRFGLKQAKILGRHNSVEGMTKLYVDYVIDDGFESYSQGENSVTFESNRDTFELFVPERPHNVFTPCHDFKRIYRLSSHFDLSASLGTDLTVRRQAFDIEEEGLRWNLNWSSCDDLPGQPNYWVLQEFNTVYERKNGKLVDVILSFSGESGSAAFKRDRTIDLYNVTYSDDNNVVSGLFQRNSGRIHWFQLSFIDTNNKIFRGNWGKGTVIGVKTQGSWNSANYEDAPRECGRGQFEHNGNCYNVGSQCSDYHGTNTEVCNTRFDDLQCDWDVARERCVKSCAFGQIKEDGNCFDPASSCSDYNGTDAKTCNNRNDDLSCDWIPDSFGNSRKANTCVNECPNDAFEIDGVCYQENGMCSQYNNTDKKTCTTGKDNLNCDWQSSNKTCVSDCPRGSFRIDGVCYQENGMCSQYDGTNKSTCTNNEDNLNCNWQKKNQTCTQSCSGSNSFEIDGVCYNKNGSCSQYNGTNSKTCNTGKDNLRCDWRSSSNTCVPD